MIKKIYGRFVLEKYDVKFLQQHGAHLGKSKASKASIEDLFEVE